MTRIVGAAVVAALVAPAAAGAHEPGVGTSTGFVATVSAVEPNVVGLQARVVLGDQLLVTNLTDKRVELLDRAGKPFIRIPSGSSRAWHDRRIVGRGEPPPPVAGAPETASRFVKNWRIPGRVAGRAFAIEGFLGWVPPGEDEDGGAPPFVLAGGAAALLAFSLLAAYLLGRRTS